MDPPGPLLRAAGMGVHARLRALRHTGRSDLVVDTAKEKGRVERPSCSSDDWRLPLTERLPPDVLRPAPGIGALALARIGRNPVRALDLDRGLLRLVVYLHRSDMHHVLGVHARLTGVHHPAIRLDL